nr:hypothetical protein [Tanacetum cinerariifolium]
MRIEESLNVTFDESLPEPKSSLSVEDDRINEHIVQDLNGSPSLKLMFQMKVILKVKEKLEYGTGPHLHVYSSSKATRSGLKLTRGPLLEYGTWPYLPVCSSSKATQSGLKLTGFEDEDEDKDDIKGLIWVDNHIANKREKSGQM